MHHSDSLLVYSTAPTCFDVNTYLCRLLYYTIMFMQLFLVAYAEKSFMFATYSMITYLLTHFMEQSPS
jgi:hypothetical protein